MTPSLESAFQSCEEHIAGSRAPKTVLTYHYGLKALRDFLIERKLVMAKPVTQITMEHFIDFTGWLARHHTRKSTRGTYLAASKSMLDWLVINNHLQPSYQEDLRYKKALEVVRRRREAPIPKTPTPAELQQLRRAAAEMPADSPLRERNIALVEFLFTTGCRVDEARKLLIRQIDLKTGKAKVTGKGSKDRFVFLEPGALRVLQAYWTARRAAAPGHPVFARHGHGYRPGQKVAGMSTKTMWATVKDLAAFAGVENFHPHSFRHGFATRMLTETGNLALVQDMMGHASPVATRVYAQVSTDQMQEAHKKVYGQ